MLQGLKECAVALSDPFGGDAVDFDVKLAFKPSPEPEARNPEPCSGPYPTLTLAPAQPSTHPPHPNLHMSSHPNYPPPNHELAP